jgi:putative membrane protein
MLRLAVVTCVVLALAVGVAAAVVPGIDVEGGIFTLLWVGLLFGLVNAVLGPVLRLISLPLTVITLGLFA